MRGVVGDPTGGRGKLRGLIKVVLAGKDQVIWGRDVEKWDGNGVWIGHGFDGVSLGQRGGNGDIFPFVDFVVYDDIDLGTGRKEFLGWWSTETNTGIKQPLY
jgi:hypothetical protein